MGLRRIPSTERELLEWGATRDERGRWHYPRELREAIQALAAADTADTADGSGDAPALTQLEWLRGVLNAWNAAAAALHTHGINVFDSSVRAMPWGALLARIEHLYYSDAALRALIDHAAKDGKHASR